jgi:hypothetical protein
MKSGCNVKNELKRRKPWQEEWGSGDGAGGEMTQTMYAHVNKYIKKKRRKP